MADTQHNLRIKATLDTSQLQQEIDRLNQTGGQKSAGTSGTQGTTRILNKLDSTLTKLNTTLQQFSQALSKSSSSAGSAQLVGNIGTGIGYAPFQRPVRSRTKSVQTQRMLQNTDFDRIQGIIDPLTFEMAHQLIRSRESTAAERAEGWGLLRRSLMNQRQQLMNFMGPLNQQQQSQIDSIDNLLFAKRDMPTTDWQSRRQNILDQRDFKRRIASFGVGAISHMIGSQLNQFGQLAESGSTTQMVLQGTGNVLGAAGSGAMVGAAFGPVGAGVGAALAGLSQAAIEVSRAFQQLESKITDYVESANKAYGSASTGLITANAQYRFNDLSQFNIGSYRDTIDSLQRRRIGQLTQIKELTSGDITEQDAETLKKLQQELAKTESELAAYESALATLMQRRAETSTEEEEAGKALARAEREFADALIAEERAIAQWHSDSQSNIKSYREAQKQYMETMLRGRESTQDRMQRMGFEREVQMVRLGMWRGGNAEDQFRNARRLRTQIMDLNAEALSTDSPKRLEEIQKLITGMQGEFQHAMMMGQLLKDLGSPLQKMQLGSLTSLANRGVNMGERTEMQRPYDKKMDEMVDLLQNIEENTRAAEKAIWE